MKKLIVPAFLLLAALTAGTLASCGEASGTVEGTDEDTSPATEAVTEELYNFPSLDCGGDTFTILNAENIWNMNTYLDYETQNGEILADTIYNRMRRMEDDYNVTFDIREGGIYDLAGMISTDVMAGDGLYDVAYSCGKDIGGIMTKGCCMNLADIDTLQLDEPWWNQETHRQAILGEDNAVYFAQSDVSLVGFDLTWCMFFNERLLSSLDGEMPYDIVKAGKWTLDKMSEYMKLGANLNGDDTFELEGNSVYGLMSYYNYASALMIGAGLHFTEKDASGYPVLSVENARFYDVTAKIAEVLKPVGEYRGGTTGNGDSQRLFKEGRSLLFAGEVKDSGVFRDMADTFGILPIPKYDEAQESYSSWTNYLSLVMTIPATTKDPERAGTLMDVMSYLSYRDVMPVYYDVTVSQKGLRNDESVEMLGIIRDSIHFEASMSYGWTNALVEKVRDKIHVGDSDVASTVASYVEKINKSIDEMMTNFANIG